MTVIAKPGTWQCNNCKQECERVAFSVSQCIDTDINTLYFDMQARGIQEYEEHYCCKACLIQAMGGLVDELVKRGQEAVGADPAPTTEATTCQQ